MYGRCISRLCSSESVSGVIVSNLPVDWSSLMVARSRRRGPSGVS